MEFWVLWFIGIGITIGTRIAIYLLISSHSYYSIEERSKRMQVIMNLLAIICIILVGGIANGKWLSIFPDVEMRIWYYILVAIVPAFFTYFVGYFVLGLYYFSSKISQVIFIVVFIISIIGWTIPICNYNRNIETITETIITSTQERKLLYFCNIPVQEISGNIYGHSVLGSGNISGSISTLDELSYWYANENNEGKYDTAEVSSSKIVFISDEEKPYIEIISYSTYTKTINHNNGREDTRPDKVWEEYIFYLPEAIMQYELY
mgnify:FL=1